MKAIIVKAPGGLDRVECIELPDPGPPEKIHAVMCLEYSGHQAKRVTTHRRYVHEPQASVEMIAGRNEIKSPCTRAARAAPLILPLSCCICPIHYVACSRFVQT